MKELSIEEKAKAYDKVSKEVKDFFEGKQKMYNDVNQTLEHLFPELKESEDERIVKCLLNYFHHVRYNGLDLKGTDVDEVLAWLEKQGEQKSLYIRFGDVPNNEKSKIYRGEKEIGEENGVSVYPAFEVNGNIVLGLTLPITKTTLHTQQHLLEYDDRPCYLVKGNYVGKDTDGQPLIDNVHIIRKIDTYRVKEKKQGEQKEIDWNEELKKCKDNPLYFFDKYMKVKLKEQKPDWSEEDEKMLNDAIVAVYAAAYHTYNDRQKIENWLKSIKQRITNN